MSKTLAIEVGTPVLYVVRRGDRPVAGNVSRVTKAQFRVTLVGGSEVGPFSLKTCWQPGFEYHEMVGRNLSSRYSKPYVAIKTYETEVLLNEQATEIEREKAEKRAAEEAKRNERDRRGAKRLTAVKDVIGDLSSVVSLDQRKPGGTRFLVVDLPINPEFVDRKGGWDTLIIRIKEVPESERWGDVNDKYSASYTYMTEASGSFSSISPTKYATEDEAIWSIIRDRYFDGSSW